MIADWPVQLHASLARCSTSSSPAPRMTGQVGTWRYMAPEVVRREHYNEKIDIYSFGLILYFIFSGKQWLDLDWFRTNFVFCRCGSTWYGSWVVGTGLYGLYGLYLNIYIYVICRFIYLYCVLYSQYILIYFCLITVSIYFGSILWASSQLRPWFALGDDEQAILNAYIEGRDDFVLGHLPVTKGEASIKIAKLLTLVETGSWFHHWSVFTYRSMVLHGPMRKSRSVILMIVSWALDVAQAKILDHLLTRPWERVSCGTFCQIFGIEMQINDPLHRNA